MSTAMKAAGAAVYFLLKRETTAYLKFSGLLAETNFDNLSADSFLLFRVSTKLEVLLLSSNPQIKVLAV